MNNTKKSIGDRCALCGNILPNNNQLSICPECLKIADCCVGLESLSKKS
ncbi:MAG TPA: hypothetical protein VIP70_09060 [Nitrososphaeraceae archaeon]